MQIKVDYGFLYLIFSVKNLKLQIFLFMLPWWSESVSKIKIDYGYLCMAIRSRTFTYQRLTIASYVEQFQLHIFQLNPTSFIKKKE